MLSERGKMHTCVPWPRTATRSRVLMTAPRPGVISPFLEKQHYRTHAALHDGVATTCIVDDSTPEDPGLRTGDHSLNRAAGGDGEVLEVRITTREERRGAPAPGVYRFLWPSMSKQTVGSVATHASLSGHC